MPYTNMTGWDLFFSCGANSRNSTVAPAELGHIQEPVEDVTSYRWVGELAGGVTGCLLLFLTVLVVVKRYLAAVERLPCPCLPTPRPDPNNISDAPDFTPPSPLLPCPSVIPEAQLIEMSTLRPEPSHQVVMQGRHVVGIYNPGAIRTYM